MLGADRHDPPGLARLQGPDSRPSPGGTRDEGPLAPVRPQCVRRMGLCRDPQAACSRPHSQLGLARLRIPES